MIMQNTWNNTVAFLAPQALVAGDTPANVGGFLTGGAAIVASAATTADGITFSESWSSSSLPEPNTNWYDYTANNGTRPTKRYCYLNNDITADTLILGHVTHAVELFDSYGSDQQWSSRKSPLSDSNESSVHLCLNGHKIDAKGKTMLAAAESGGTVYSANTDFVYGFYGNSKENEVITNSASMGTNRGGTWVLNGVELTDFESIAELKGDVKWSETWSLGSDTTATATEYYRNFRAVLNMKNTSAECVNGVNIVSNGTFNMDNSSIMSAGSYAVALNDGEFNISGNSKINGTVIIAGGNKIGLAGGAKLTGNITISLAGTQPTAGEPVVITSGAGDADLSECTIVSADGYNISLNADNELVLEVN